MDEITLCRQEWAMLFGRLDACVEQAKQLNASLDELLADLEAVEKGLEVA